MLKNLRKKLKKGNAKGFTLVELVISMAIFGFLLYIITAILIVIVSTVNQIDQRAFLRSQIEAALNQIVGQIQFATNVTSCGASCLSMTVPSTYVQGGTVSTITNADRINTALNALGNQTIAENVAVNGSSTYKTSFLLSDTVVLNSLTFNIETGNILVAIDAQINDTGGNKIAELVLSSNVQYNK